MGRKKGKSSGNDSFQEFEELSSGTPIKGTPSVDNADLEKTIVYEDLFSKSEIEEAAKQKKISPRTSQKPKPIENTSDFPKQLSFLDTGSIPEIPTQIQLDSFMDDDDDDVQQTEQEPKAKPVAKPTTKKVVKKDPNKDTETVKKEVSKEAKQNEQEKLQAPNKKANLQGKSPNENGAVKNTAEVVNAKKAEVARESLQSASKQDLVGQKSATPSVPKQMDAQIIRKPTATKQAADQKAVSSQRQGAVSPAKNQDLRQTQQPNMQGGTQPKQVKQQRPPAPKVNASAKSTGAEMPIAISNEENYSDAARRKMPDDYMIDMRPNAQGNISAGASFRETQGDLPQVKQPQTQVQRQKNIATQADKVLTIESITSDGKSGKIVRNVFEWVEEFVIAGVIIALIFTFLFRIVTVEGYSMLPNYDDGYRVISTNSSNNLKQGDVVIITNVHEGSIIKRVIATEGQTVDLDPVKKAVVVDGVAVDDSQFGIKNGITEAGWNDYVGLVFPQVVPKGCVFVLGDNRTASLDSRYEKIGMVDERNVLGKVIFDIYPFNRFGPAK